MCVCVFVHFCNFYGLFLENDIIVCSDFGHKFLFSFSLYSCCYVLFLPYLIVRGWAWDVGRHVCWRNGNEECQVSSKGILTLSMISFCLSLLLLFFHNTFFFLPFLSLPPTLLPSLSPSHPPSLPPSLPQLAAISATDIKFDFRILGTRYYIQHTIYPSHVLCMYTCTLHIA